MNEVVSQGFQILYKGYPLTFAVTVAFYILIKLLMLIKVKEEAE